MKRFGDDSIIFGVPEKRLPIRGAPAGKKRLRLRNGEFARLFVRPPEGGIRHFILCERGGVWVPDYEQGANEVRT